MVSLAFFSTFISTSTYIGQAGESFRFGFSWVYVGLIWVLFCIISWLFLGPRMRAQSVRLKSVTVPDYFHLRYQSDLSKIIRVLSSAIILFISTKFFQLLWGLYWFMCWSSNLSAGRKPDQAHLDRVFGSGA